MDVICIVKYFVLPSKLYRLPTLVILALFCISSLQILNVLLQWMCDDSIQETRWSVNGCLLGKKAALQFNFTRRILVPWQAALHSY